MIKQTDVMVSIPMPKDLARLARVLASDMNMSRSKLIRELVIKELENKKKIQLIKKESKSESNSRG